MQVVERAVWCFIQGRLIMRLGHALLSVFVGKDCGSRGVKRRVVIGMVEVPVGIDDVFHRSVIDAVERLFEFRPRGRNESVHDEFAVGAVEDYHASAGPESIVGLSASFCVWMGAALNFARILATRSAAEGACC